MEKIKLLAFTCFTLSLLLISDFYTKPAHAQLAITIVSLGATHGNLTTDFGSCDYVSTTQVWCATTTGIKVWNPTSRTVTTTIESSNSFNDVKCSSTYCYLWDITASTTANLTQYQISGFVRINETEFAGNAGFVVGHGIGLVSVSDGTSASNVLLLPVEGQDCLGGNDNKGVCVFSGSTFQTLRFITSSATNDIAVVYDIEWNGETASIAEPTANRAIVKFRDAAGNFQLYNLDLASSGTTFATTSICNTGNVLTIQQFKLVVIDGIVYDNSASQDMNLFDTTNSSCGEIAKTNFIDETNMLSITYDDNDSVFIISATTDGATETNGVYTFNSTGWTTTTGFNRITKVNLTASSTNNIWTHFNHASEGEVQVWRGSDMVIISGLIEATSPSIPSGGEQTNGVCGVGTALDCVGDRSTINQITGGTSWATLGNSIFGGIGLVNTTASEDVKENGTGLLLMLMLGAFFSSITIGSISVANNKFGAGISYTEIPKEFWLFLVVGVVSTAYYLQWIPDIVFYAMIVGLAGLFSFGLYKHIRGG